MNWLEKRKIQKYLESLSDEQIRKLKAYYKNHCPHGVSFNSDIPCLECMSTYRFEDLAPFLLR